MQNRIKEKIREAGMMLKDVASQLDITTVGLTQIVNTAMPRIETLEKIAKVLNVPAWSLMLSDDEIEEIRNTAPRVCSDNEFVCPKCGAVLKVELSADEKPTI